VNRRRFAGWLVALLGTVAGAAVFLRRPKGVRPVERDREERGGWQGAADADRPPRTLAEGAALAAAIRAYYEYLDLDPAGVQAFVTAYDAARGRRLVNGTLADALPRYLLSTDFFLHGEDATRRLGFVAFYHPRVTPCFRPFSIAT
jgi:hypothetical protein